MIVLKLVEEDNKKVIVSGLTCDFQRKKFGSILDLEPYCDTFTKLNSYCKSCSVKKPRVIRKALFSHRLNKTKSKMNIVEIGGSDKYIPVCKTHWKEACL